MLIEAKGKVHDMASYTSRSITGDQDVSDSLPSKSKDCTGRQMYIQNRYLQPEHRDFGSHVCSKRLPFQSETLSKGFHHSQRLSKPAADVKSETGYIDWLCTAAMITADPLPNHAEVKGYEKTG